jgi:hypothetical protein
MDVVVYSSSPSANLLLAVTFGAPQAHAFSCSVLPLEAQLREQLERSDVAFSGVVLDRALVSGDRYFGPVTFDVEESWKGISEEPVVVRAYEAEPSCAVGFHEDERYPVYASYDEQEETTFLVTDHCSGTKLLSNAGAALQALRLAEFALSESVELESIGSTPASGFWTFSERIVAGSVATPLALAAVGVLLPRRRRRPG